MNYKFGTIESYFRILLNTLEFYGTAAADGHAAQFGKKGSEMVKEKERKEWVRVGALRKRGRTCGAAHGGQCFRGVDDADGRAGRVG